MGIISNLTLKEYLLENDILVGDDYFKGIRDINEKKVMEQIIIIQNAHKILSGYNCYGITRINSTIGRRVEHIKVMLKRLRKDLERRDSYKEINPMDKFILSNGNKILSKGEMGINALKEVDYIGIIKRSMKKNEIALGRVDEKNLRVTNELEIGTLKNISYNLVEEDVYDYLKRVRIKNKKISLEKCIDKYIESSHLSDDSRDYIYILLMIPYGTLNLWYKYAYGRKGDSWQEQFKKIKLLSDSEI
ncbi:MAG: hypothetical protein SOY42_06850 [Clostridium sp.]|nr:hypothetical protein [Clostridium sp.]